MVIFGSRRRRTPTVVATPLPPFHPRNGLQQCPATAAIPIIQCAEAGSPEPNSSKARYPLAISPTSATAARGRVDTRNTLLKPGFPDPTLVMSIPVPHIATLA